MARSAPDPQQVKPHKRSKDTLKAVMVPRVPFQELAVLIKLLHVPAHCTFAVVMLLVSP